MSNQLHGWTCPTCGTAKSECDVAHGVDYTLEHAIERARLAGIAVHALALYRMLQRNLPDSVLAASDCIVDLGNALAADGWLGERLNERAA